MIDFGLSPEQTLLRDEAASLLARSCPTSRVREVEVSGSDLDDRLLREIAEMGWIGVALPEELGGGGAGVVEAALLASELGASLASVPYVELVATVGLLQAVARDDLQRQLLPRIASAEIVVVPAMGLRGGILGAVARTDGAVALTGAVQPTRFAGSAGLILVGGRHANGAHELLLVDPRDEGVEILESVALGGERLASIRLSGAVVPPERRVATISAQQSVRELYTRAWPLAASSWCGAAARALSITVEYTKSRRQFDRPIAAFQAVQHELAWIDVDTAGARLLSLQAAAAVGRGDPAALSLAPRAALVAAAAMRRAARSSVQFHGGYGFTLEYDPQLFFRRARYAQYAWGTPSQIRPLALPYLESTKEARGGLLAH